MLEDILIDHDNAFIMDVESVLHNESLFTVHNELNNYGQKAFWSEVDHQLEKFEKKRFC